MYYKSDINCYLSAKNIHATSKMNIILAYECMFPLLIMHKTYRKKMIGSCENEFESFKTKWLVVQVFCLILNWSAGESCLI